MSSFEEIITRWMQDDQIYGVAFARDETVAILSGDSAGALGTIVSLLQVEPSTQYRVTTVSGQNLECDESSLVGASALADATAFAKLQRWYAAQCDGDWEHVGGVHLTTLDNPGWMLQIDLTDTGLENRPFVDISEEIEGAGWAFCQIKAGKFEGACGPHRLSRIVQIFITWAEADT